MVWGDTGALWGAVPERLYHTCSLREAPSSLNYFVPFLWCPLIFLPVLDNLENLCCRILYPVHLYLGIMFNRSFWQGGQGSLLPPPRVSNSEWCLNALILEH